MNLEAIKEKRREEIFDEIMEILSNLPYDIGEHIDEETVADLAEQAAQGELDDYFDQKYEEEKDRRMEME